MTKDCPNCGKQYRIFDNPNWKGDQSLCQACSDEAIEPVRKVMIRIEHSFAMAELREQIGDEEIAQLPSREAERIEKARERRLLNAPQH